MGTVFLAARADDQYQKRVAIKVVSAGPGIEDVVRHFRRERQILASLDHPNIARMLDGGATEDGLPYFVMEYIDGLTLHRYCDGRRLGISDRLLLFRELCSAAQYAHQHLVVHRDLKPGNILVAADGIPKLLDFGIAKLLNAEFAGEGTLTQIALTPQYASPEQARGDKVTTATDVYSLGVILYELLTGHHPYKMQGIQPLDVLRAVIEEDAERPSEAIYRHKGSLEATSPTAGSTAESVSRARGETPERLRRTLRGDLDNILMMALRKEPQSRYASVEALSEDVRRHMAGLPIHAAKRTASYRMHKFLRRNARAVLAVLLILGLATVSLHARWTAARQASVASAFTQLIEQSGWSLRVATMAPLHDLRPEKARMVVTLQNIRKRMAELGAVGEGPGEFALGRGELALGHNDEAAGHLRRAWALGQRGPEVAYALGLVTGNLYLRELRATDAIGNRTLREARRGEIQATLRDPAVEYLRKSAGVELAAPEYVEGLIAMYEGHAETALELAGRALEEAPWLHEALVLEGNVYTKQSQTSHEQGDADASRKAATAAESAYARAVNIARSDPVARGGLCQVALQRMEWVRYSGADLQPSYTKARAVCEEALAVDSDNGFVHARLANIHRFYADYLQRRGQDASAVVSQAISEAQEALRIDPNDRRAHGNLGNIYLLRAIWLSDHGQDAAAAYASGIASLSRAAEIGPDEDSLNDLSNAYIAHGQFLQRHGLDGLPDIETAIAGYRRILERVPEFAYAHGNLGESSMFLSTIQLERGIDPTVSLDGAVAALEHASALMPGTEAVHTALGEAYLSRADFMLLRGSDPRPDIEQARRHNAEAARLSSSASMEHVLCEGGVARLQATLAFWNHLPPAQWAAEARGAFRHAKELDPALPDGWEGLAGVELLDAQLRTAGGLEPNPALDNAEAALRSARRLDPNSESIASAFADLHHWRAQAVSTKGGDPDAEIGQGLAELEIALNTNPRSMNVLARKLVLLNLRARLAKSMVERGEAVAAAQAAERDGLKRDVFFERRIALLTGPPAH
jgi:tetratricopeptide (TPR) repeat protein